MSNGQPGNRVRLGVIIALLLGLALGSFWLLEVLRRSSDDTLSDKQKNEPDYMVEKFNFVRMSDAGSARYNISGAKLTHFPDDDTFEIELPVLKSLSVDQAPMTMRAEKAMVENTSNRIHMQRNVQVDRPASGTREKLHITSEYLLILPNDDVMQTDKRVDITFGETKLNGVGMYVNNATREFRLSNQVHGTYQPPKQQGNLQ